ncbi:MAG: right-handed parallel beta-helix repeat-containing protein [Flavobacterium sp.]|nr:right-handed parallel beta-helix repeat-containing protein [Flavobacterium sp.]
MKLLFSIAFYFSLFAAFASDITIYVSPKGNGNGAIQTPTTLEKAVDMLPGLKSNNPKGTITIILNEGEYELSKPITITNENGGTKDFKIIFKAAVEAHPVVSGGRNILLIGDKILSADISSLLKDKTIEINDIYVHAKRAIRARTPNDNFFQLGKTYEIKDSAKIGIGKSTQHYEIPSSLYDELSHLSPSELKKARCNIYHKWDNTIVKIDSLDRKNSAFYFTGSEWKSYNVISEKSIFYMENAIESLDAPNEWFLDGNVLKYIPSDSKINNLKITIPILEKLIIIKGDVDKDVSNVTFQGISFCYTNTSGMYEDDFQAAMSVDAAVMLDFANNINFEDCEISHIGQYAIWFRKSVQDCSISHSYLHDLGAGGVRIGETLKQSEINKNMRFSSGNKISNCIIHSGGFNYPTAVGVFIAHASNNRIEHNDIGDFRYSGVSVGWVWGYTYSPAVNNKIVYNHIHHIGWGVLSDMAGVYTLGISDGTEVSNNVVHDVYSYGYGGWGLYTDEGSSNIRMENNLVYKTKTGGFHQHYGKNNVINNNIIAFNNQFQAQFSRVEAHHSFDFQHNILISDKGVMLQGPWQKGDITIDNNCYWNMNNKKCIFTDSALTLKKWQKKSGKDVHSISQDPGFVNAKEYNFKFKDLSTVKKIGFEPFDIDKVGVFGDMQWKKKAELPQEILAAFSASVDKNMLH